ncbi:MAG: EAL domain-containing protein [Burkholderiaceae bacterium]
MTASAASARLQAFWPAWDRLPCAVALVDAKGLLLLCNGAFEQLARAPQWQWLAPASLAALQRAWSGRQDFELELELALAEPGGWWRCQSRWDAGLAAHVSVWQDISAGKRAEREGAEKLSQFHLLADNVPTLIALYQAKTYRCLFANRGYAHTFGLTEQSILGLSFEQIIGGEAADFVGPIVREVERGGQPGFYERQLSAPDGSPRWIEAHVIPHKDVDGRVQSAFVQIVDITRHRLAERAARESEERLAKFMQASMEGIAFHRDGIITDVNPPLCALLGYSLEELKGRLALGFLPEGERAAAEQRMLKAQEFGIETTIAHRDGHRIAVEIIVRTYEHQGERQRMVIVRDIRDRLEAQARIHHLAHHDALTGLLNRSAFMERLHAALHRARDAGRPLALLFIDLDNFKRVNDSLGHLEGDQVLGTVAERISACLRASDLVARFGGDEFVVLLDEVYGRDDVVVVLEALLSIVEVPVKADGRALSVTPSIGVAMFPEHGQSAAELIQHADTAMYGAKSRGRATYQFFEPALAATAYAELVLESQLAQALERNEFVLHYQPQVSPRDGRLIGAEALLRWQHPERGLLGPDAFIAVAERHRLMLPLGAWVMRAAALQARDWHARGVAAVPIAVNLSRMQFHLDGFADTVAEVLAELKLPGEWLELELTERMLMDDVASAPATLAALRALGLTISVDDFGTGYTSLAHLTQLPLDKLKIDQSFVAKLPEDAGAAAITRAIVQMGAGLGLHVSAEGVRSRAQWELLAGWGCEELQGELIGLPMAAADFEQWLRERR